MKATSIVAHELSFKETGKDSFGKKFNLNEVQVNVPGFTEKLKLTDCIRENGDKSFYFEEIIPKTKIVLHFTAGYLKGDIGTLTQAGNHVSVPFVIARNGEIYNLFTSKYWSYHLGKNAVGGNTDMSQKTIAIEISNIGCLKKIGNNLVTTYSNSDIYCSLDETSYYTKVSNYRGFEYFATFTQAQYNSLKLLLKFLTNKYSIPYNFLPLEKRFNVFANAAEANAFKGICSHVNFRTDKWDIGTAFDWNKII
ncbi:MAG: N-acetylmuramoyl-L-alanine amidase [Bacteroidetes bacterium]|nr:N-acetylmuramoyl-L-alanine amidase [Bacteroidota bacterium]